MYSNSALSYKILSLKLKTQVVTVGYNQTRTFQLDGIKLAYLERGHQFKSNNLPPPPLSEIPLTAFDENPAGSRSLAAPAAVGVVAIERPTFPLCC